MREKGEEKNEKNSSDNKHKKEKELEKTVLGDEIPIFVCNSGNFVLCDF